MPEKSIICAGFTLIEVTMSIVVMSIIAVLAGMGLYEISKGYVLSKQNATAAQQGQVAITRIRKELGAIQSIACGDKNTITYTSERNPSEYVTLHASTDSTVRLIMNPANLTCDDPGTAGDKLIENVDVKTFELNYCRDAANCSPSYNASYLGLDYTSATVTSVKIVLKLKGYEDAIIPIADPDRVLLHQGTGD